MNSLVSFAENAGIKLTQPEKNLLTKLEADYGIKISSAATLQPSTLVNVLIYFVRGCNTGFGPVTYQGKKVLVSIFDRTRYLILRLDNKAYSTFID